MTGGTAIPFCGLPPLPGEAGWTLDPLLLAVLLGGLAWGWRSAADRRLFLAGFAVLAATLVSPLCSLAVALFSARAGQHMLMMLVAAPLLALSLRAREPAPLELALSAAALAVALWFWHVPGPYGLTFVSHGAWWGMHASLLLTSVWFWQGVLRAVRFEAALLSGLATAAQMGALGAFLTFAPRPLFVAHAFSTLPWGLTPLEDQQLGGLILWVPGGLGFAALALFALSRALSPGADPDARPDPA